MRKTTFISLAATLAIAFLVAGLEHLRAIYFMAPRLGTTETPHQGLGFKLGRWMQHAEWATSDFRFKLRGPRPPHPDVVIVAIDEKSLATLHEWPWPRSVHADLINALSKAPPKALLFDVLFLEPFSADRRGDRKLVKATQGRPWVVHSLFLEVQGQQVVGGRIPFNDLAAVSETVGSVNAFVDDDGVLRSAPLELHVEDQSVPLLALVGAGLAVGKPSGDLARRVTLDPRGELLVDWAGADHAFPYISYADVISGAVPPERFAGKVLLIGSNATGTYDHYPTPFSAVMPGVEMHATIIDNLLSGRGLRSAGLRWTYIAIAVMAFLCGLWLVRLSAWVGVLTVVLLAVGFGGLAQWLFSKQSLTIDTAGPWLTLGLGYVAVVVFRFFTEEQEKRWVKAAFGQYVSPKVLELLIDDPTKLNLVGERRDITVFFSDVAGFTSLSERLNPDELVVLLNRYLSSMTEVIFEYDGYLNKYMGDGIMAFWNAPLLQADHAERACRCALKSVTRLQELNAELQRKGHLPLSARIGINSGAMVVGNMGSRQKSDYTVMGDHVNLGSRLEGANKAFGTSVMISEFTYELVKDKFEVRFLDRIRVPGKAKPVKTYELLAEKGALPERWGKALPLYHEAIQNFAEREFEGAHLKLLEVIRILGHDKACETYLERSKAFMATPPARDWDGVFELKTK